MCAEKHCILKRFLCSEMIWCLAQTHSSFSQKIFVSVLAVKPCVGQTLTRTGQLPDIATVVSDSTSSVFSIFPTTLTMADNMFLGQGFVAGLRKGQVEGNKCWSWQLEGDPNQMLSSLAQMYFTFPYPPLAHSRTVTDRVLSQLCYVWRWVEGEGGSGTCSGP